VGILLHFFVFDSKAVFTMLKTALFSARKLRGSYFFARFFASYFKSCSLYALLYAPRMTFRISS
jgi:hypothetical protein